MFSVQASAPTGQLVIFGQAFVEPEGNLRDDGVEVGMGCFVPEVISHLISPKRIDRQPRIGPSEEGSANRKLGEVGADVSVELVFVFEQKNVNGFVGAGQSQGREQVASQVGQLTDQPMFAGQFEIVMDSELPPAEKVFRGELNAGLADATDQEDQQRGQRLAAGGND